MNDKVWIGFANVAPHHKDEHDFDGAYVNILSVASNQEEFAKKAKNAVDQEKMFLIDLTEVELLDDRAENYILSDELMHLADEAKTSGAVCFTEFHTYDAKDSN